MDLEKKPTGIEGLIWNSYQYAFSNNFNNNFNNKITCGFRENENNNNPDH